MQCDCEEETFEMGSTSVCERSRGKNISSTKFVDEVDLGCGQIMPGEGSCVNRIRGKA